MKHSFKGVINILLAAALLIGAMFIYSNFIKPAYDEIKEKQGEFNVKEAEYEKSKLIFEESRQILSSFQDSQGLKDTLFLILPPEQKIPEALYQISGMASLSGLTLGLVSTEESAITPTISPLLKNVGTLKINVKMSGAYEAFKSFAEKLENNIRLFGVNSIRITKSENVSNVFDFMLEIGAFYQTD